MKKPVIAITMGDPAGVGPEICLKAAADASVRRICAPVIFGDRTILTEVGRRCRIPVPKGSALVDFGLIKPGEIKPGRIQRAAGAASFRYVEAAIGSALKKQVAAVVTAPINKEALNLAGRHFPGHTEILARLTRARRICMMFASETIACGLVTTHCALAEVPGLITRQRVRDAIELTAEAVARLRAHPPRLTVCGLNPHAGEHGLFGREETAIARVIADMKKRGMRIVGPLPADTAFLERQRACTDAYICMYHDQGLIPFKMLSFDTGVNITLGLPIVRTSVDHGTAFDIAWTGRADHRSMVQAVRYAVKLSRR
jgi:4-phospho-D-threonate 3-dehydrogenase / 4-phospho-D-erythronate 3-dehydrogenase